MKLKGRYGFAIACASTLSFILVMTFQPFPSDALLKFPEMENTYLSTPNSYIQLNLAAAVKKAATPNVDVISGITAGNPAGPPNVQFVNPGTLNGTDFARLCKWIGASKCGYVYGASGEVCTKALCDYEDSRFGSAEAQGAVSFSKWNGRLSFDCSGVLRGYSRYRANTKTFGNAFIHTYGGVDDIVNQSKGLPSGDISTLPDVPGIAVLPAADKNGGHPHIGYYIGNGLIMDANSSAVGCQIRLVANAKEFKSWFYIAGISYK